MESGTRRLVNRRFGWALAAVGFLAGIAAVVLAVTAVGSTAKAVFFSEACSTPCEGSIDIEAGTHLVFERIGRVDGVGPATYVETSRTTITIADVSVLSPDGQSVPVTEPHSTQTINRNGAIYRGVVAFRAPDAGQFRITVNSPYDTEVVIAPSFGQAIVKALPALALGLFGLVSVVVGLLVVMVARPRRSIGRDDAAA